MTIASHYPLDFGITRRAAYRINYRDYTQSCFAWPDDAIVSYIFSMQQPGSSWSSTAVIAGAGADKLTPTDGPTVCMTRSFISLSPSNEPLHWSLVSSDCVTSRGRRRISLSAPLRGHSFVMGCGGVGCGRSIWP